MHRIAAAVAVGMLVFCVPALAGTLQTTGQTTGDGTSDAAGASMLSNAATFAPTVSSDVAGGVQASRSGNASDADKGGLSDSTLRLLTVPPENSQRD